MYKKQKNQLKDLIYIQENKPCNEQTVKGLFRSIVEPILDSQTECVVLLRLEEKSKRDFESVLKRLEFSNADMYDFSDSPLDGKFKNIVKETVWEKTEFVYVLSARYGAVLVFDYEECPVDGFAEFYILHNSKNLADAYNVIASNATEDAKDFLIDYQEKNHPDRRDNDSLNSSIRKIVELLNETNQEILISNLEKETIEYSGEGKDLASKIEFISSKSNFVAHEIRNQLSICDLYSSIIQKQLSKTTAEEAVEKSLANALNCIQKSLKIASTSLVDLKSLNNNSFKNHCLKPLLETAIELAQVYINGKDIKINHEIETSAEILVDENKFLAILINLIKNAVECFDETQKGEINLGTKNEGSFIKIFISNNGKPIEKKVQAKIFEEGFTTKLTGSGIGLSICKKSIEEQFGELKLTKSDEKSTEFEIRLPKN